MNAVPSLPRGFRWTLLLSLALNVMLVALVVVPHLRAGGPAAQRVHAAMRMPDPRVLRDALPADRRAVVDAAMDRHRDAIRAALIAGRVERRALDQLLRSDEVDRARLEQAFTALRAREAATAAAVHAMLVDALSALTAEERALVAERMHRRGGREHRERSNRDSGETKGGP